MKREFWKTRRIIRFEENEEGILENEIIRFVLFTWHVPEKEFIN